ncbi:hypothetical protein TUM3811_22030 [Shewanella algae]|nr:hypothetical protein TUM3811_22030 [Shewanella algae]
MSQKDFKQAISHFCTLALVSNRLEMFFKVVNVHGALPKREYMITAKCDRQIDHELG